MPDAAFSDFDDIVFLAQANCVPAVMQSTDSAFLMIKGLTFESS